MIKCKLVPKWGGGGNGDTEQRMTKLNLVLCSVILHSVADHVEAARFANRLE